MAGAHVSEISVLKDDQAAKIALGVIQFQHMNRQLVKTFMKKRPQKTPSVKVEIPPYGQMLILGVDGDGALAFFKRNWPQLWPKLLREVKRMCKGFELGAISNSRTWLADGGRMEPDVFMSDESDWHLRLNMDPLEEDENGLPVFDFFIKDSKIVQCQPVF